MPKEKTVVLKKGKAKLVMLSHEEQTAIWHALSVAIVPKAFRGSVSRLEKQFREMISK
jgi:hypothetical protein